MARPLRVFRRYKPSPARSAGPAGPASPPRRTPYLAVGALVCSAALGGPAAAAAAPLAPSWIAAAQAPADAPRRFDIDGGPLPEVLAAFEAATSVQIVVDSEQVRAIQSPGVHGVMTPADALGELLMGTALRFRFTGPATATIDIEVSEFVAVEGELPRPASPKFTEPLRDTPQTITVIPQAVIEAQGASTLRDVLRNVPGITYQAGEGGGGLPGDKMTMRGFRAENDIFVDGVRDVGAYTRDAFNLEQVEVVKGPASTFGGRGTTGGAINLATKAPGRVESRSATIGLGNADYRRGTIDLNQPLDAVPGAAVRLNAMWTDSGVPGRDVVHNEGWAVAPSVAFGLGGPTRLTLSTQHTRQDNVPDYGLPWAALDAEPGVDQANFYGLRNYDHEDIASDMATARLEHEVNQATVLRNVSRWGRTVRDHAITAPRPPNRQLQQRHLENDLLTNQTSVTALLPGHTVSAGVEIVREGSATWNQAQTGNQPQVDLYAPDPSTLPFGPLPENLGNPNEATTTTLGAYLFDTVPLGDRFEATGGLRWDRAHVDYTSTNRAEGTSTAIEKTEAVVSWRGGLVYKPRPNGTVYAGVGTSFDPGYDAGNTGTGLSDSPTSASYVNLDPERTINYELGTKWDLASNRVGLTAALFRTEKTNARTRDGRGEPFVLDGEQRVTGVELGVSGYLAPWWSVLANASFMASEVVASADPDEVDGNLALTPKGAASLWTTVDVPGGVTLGGGVEFRDSVYRNATNTTEVPSYWLVNATAAWRVSEHLTLRVIGDNLGDAQYVDRVGGGHYIPGPRRSARVTTDIRF